MPAPRKTKPAVRKSYPKVKPKFSTKPAKKKAAPKKKITNEEAGKRIGNAIKKRTNENWKKKVKRKGGYA